MVKLCWLVLVLALAVAPQLGWGKVTASNLRCENKVDPLGIDSLAPRLSWFMRSSDRRQSQSAYQVLVATSLHHLKSNQGDLWDSGRVESPLPFNVAYQGHPLTSGLRAYWKVRVFDRDGQAGPWSQPAYFEMGLLHPSDWQGTWINDGKASPAQDADFYKDDPAPLFRREFALTKKLVRARLYIAGLGYYEASLNGEKVGDHVLDPGWTKFGTRVGYATYDVTHQLQSGANCLGVELGNGWYNPLPLKLFGTFNLREQLDIGRPRFVAQLNLEFADGTHESVVSDQSWQVGEGAIRFDNIYLGERVDARLEPKGWKSAGFMAADWLKPGIAMEPVGKLQTPPQPPIRVTEKFAAVKQTAPKPGLFIYDFGKEFAGWPRIHLNVPAGTKLVFRYGELLNDDGTLNPMTSVAGQIKHPHKNAAGEVESAGGPGAPIVAWQSDTYIAKGGGETYQPKFTFHAFRYMEISGLAKPVAPAAVIALRLNSDVESAGGFSCSNELFNQIQEMTRRTFLSNMFSVQSDCPHRERLGYGGDIVGTSEAFLLNFDMSGFYAKAVQDFADAARPDGMLTDTAPFIGIQYCGVGWAMAHPTLITQLLRYDGDIELLAKQYETAKRWFLLVDQQYPDGIVKEGLSDHEGLEENPSQELVTPLYFQSAKLLVSMARALGHSEDAAQFEAIERKIQNGYTSKFVNAETGKVGPGSQAAQAFGLYTGILDDWQRPTALKFLLNKIHGQGKSHLSTGLIGTKFMFDALSREGHAEDVYTMANQKDFPGWGYMLANGATTIWEHWAKDADTFSHCHPMFGSISEWFINWLGGIQDAPGSLGFNRLEIRPQFVKDLHWVRSHHVGRLGKIVSNWHRDGGRIVLDLEIPVGSTAEVRLPVREASQISESGKPLAVVKDVKRLRHEGIAEVLQVGSGHYSFSIPDPVKA
jgi:alpha-L-rhamnosidase